MVQWGTREIVRRLNRFDSLVRPAYCNEHPRDRLISGCGYAALHPVIGESSHVQRRFLIPVFFGVLFGWKKRQCEKSEVSFRVDSSTLVCGKFVKLLCNENVGRSVVFPTNFLPEFFLLKTFSFCWNFNESNNKVTLLQINNENILRKLSFLFNFRRYIRAGIFKILLAPMFQIFHFELFIFY